MLLIEIPNGEIAVDSTFGILLGFTSDLFENGSYLWRTGDAIYISSIFSRYPGKGNFKSLVQKIHEKGFTVKVPTPFARMKAILKAWEFKQTTEDSDLGECEVWVKEAPNDH